MPNIVARGIRRSIWGRLLTGNALTVTLAIVIVWAARAYGRTILFAFGINWILMAWAILFAFNVVPLRLPARYYGIIRPFEKRGRDSNPGRFYRRALRAILWTVDSSLLRSQPSARATMI